MYYIIAQFGLHEPFAAPVVLFTVLTQRLCSNFTKTFDLLEYGPLGARLERKSMLRSLQRGWGGANRQGLEVLEEQQESKRRMIRVRKAAKPDVC